METGFLNAFENFN